MKHQKTDNISQLAKFKSRLIGRGGVFLFLSLWIVALAARATPVTVPDFSFENIGVGGPGGEAGGSAGVLLGFAPNWDLSGNAGDGVQSVTNGDSFFDAATLPSPADGTNYLFEDWAPNEVARCWQDITNLQPNTVYTLTIAVGETLQGLSGAGFIALVNGQNPFQTILGETPVNTTNATPGTFSDVTLVYTTGAQVSDDLTILMEITNGSQLCFDNVRLDAEAAADPTALLPVLSSASTSNSVFTGTLLAAPTSVVYVGNTVDLSENPAGAGPFTYQWLSDNGSGGVTFGPVSGATSSSLSIDTTGFTPGSTVEYKVAVTDGAGGAISAPVSISAIAGPPVVFVDTYPTSVADNIGGSAVFAATFIGSGPISYQWLFNDGSGNVAIAGATNQTLSLSNLQATAAGSYSLVGSNSFSAVTNDPGVLVVNSPSTNTSDGVVTTTAFQIGLGGNTIFTPTWTLAGGSLIAGTEPSDAEPSLAAFQYGASGGAPVLTDGKAGTMPPAGNTSSTLAACGLAPTGASISYTLPTNGAPFGWTITNITVYGGWADLGRIEQEYDIYYSTFAAPDTYGSQINAGGSSGGYAAVDFQYPDPTGIDPDALQCATRVTLTSTNGVLVDNAAGIQLFFNIQAKDPENAWSGYGEIQVFGTPSAPKIVIVSNTAPQYAGDVVGSAVTFTTTFSAATALNYQWMVDYGSGPGPLAGATNPVLTLSNLQLGDTGSYSCVASNATGSAQSQVASLTVSSDNPPDPYNAVEGEAFQAAGVPFFFPTWTLPPGDLLAGLAPSSVGAGQFNEETASGVNVLADGLIGGIGGGNDVYMSTCGPNAGTAIYYTLPSAGAPNGYTITNIQVFGGWSDHGRDENECLVYYSTVAAPDQFTNAMATWDYLPPNPGAIPNMTRVSATGNAGPLATNVAGIEVAFIGGENGYEGYSEIAAYGTPTTTSIPISVVLVRDIIPFNAADVVGSSETFKAIFNSSDPITYQWYIIQNGVTTPVSGATQPSLTLANLQIAETGSYYVVASNALGVASSSTNSITVNPAPTPASGVTEAFAFQQTFAGGPELSPTWTLAPGDLLEGLTATTLLPSAEDFAQGGCGPASNLTDGSIGYVGGTTLDFCSCGDANNNVGSIATYNLAGSSSGYNLSQIVTYGGWQDTGRDWQNYTVLYATAGAPTNFTKLASVVYQASTVVNAGVPNMTRVTIAPASGSVLANNVVAIEFNFADLAAPPAQENGWQGYSELAVYGQAAAPPLSFTSASFAAGSLSLSGSGGTPGSPYTILSATNVLGPWVTNSAGVFSVSGGFSNAIPVLPSVENEFFRLQVP